MLSTTGCFPHPAAGTAAGIVHSSKPEIQSDQLRNESFSPPRQRKNYQVDAQVQLSWEKPLTETFSYNQDLPVPSLFSKQLPVPVTGENGGHEM